VVNSAFKAQKKYDLFGYIDRVPYEGVRKAIGEHMVKSMFTIPHVTHTDLIDITALADLREKQKKEAEKEGLKLTYLAYILKACVLALQEHPYLNSSLEEAPVQNQNSAGQPSQIILKKYFNIGLAVDTEVGLMVPVLKGADKKPLFQLAKEIAELAEKARSRKINPMDMKGGTFTITNVGSSGGGWFFTPVINYPEAAILGLGMMQEMPRFSANTDSKKKPDVENRKMLPVSLSFDHRIVDGAEAARFVNKLKSLLEQPETWSE